MVESASPLRPRRDEAPYSLQWRRGEQHHLTFDLKNEQLISMQMSLNHLEWIDPTVAPIERDEQSFIQLTKLKQETKARGSSMVDPLITFTFELNPTQRKVTVTRIGSSMVDYFFNQLANIGGLQNSLSSAVAALVAFFVRPCFVAHINRRTFLVRKSNKQMVQEHEDGRYNRVSQVQAAEVQDAQQNEGGEEEPSLN